MTSSVSKFVSWLRLSRTTIPKGVPVTCVMGNEASDLDSIACALSYAFLLNSADPQARVLPLINIPRADLDLRTETTALLQQIGIEKQDLSFTPEVPIDEWYKNGQLSLVLVDHNQLAGTQSDWGAAVTGVLDHHKDEGLYTNSSVRDIRVVGSCATIVTEHIQKENPTILATYPEVCRLLLAPILLDTVNMNEAAARGTAADAQALTLLSSHLQQGQQASNVDLDTMFNELQRTRFDTSSLSIYDNLRKDYKQFTKPDGTQYGIASVFMDASTFVSTPSDVQAMCEQWCQEKGLYALYIMHAYLPNASDVSNIARDITVSASNPENGADAVAALRSVSDLDLQEIPNTSDTTTTLVSWRQLNITYSRKRLQPALNKYWE